MRTIAQLTVVSVLLGAGALSALAQDGFPPEVEIIRWIVVQEGGTETVYDRDESIGSPLDIDDFLHEELDIIFVTLEITDRDWDPNGDADTENEGVFVRFTAVGDETWAPPDATPITEASNDFFGATSENGFAPPGGETTVEVAVVFQVPTFLGKNQSRLRGYIDFDVRWVTEFSVSNEQEPQTDEESGVQSGVSTIAQVVKGIERPSLGPTNAPAFADAGADRTVPAGYVVVLDGSRSYDSFNLGFDAGDDINIFEKDKLRYTWEWISGPARVDPEQTNTRDPTATVLLTVADPDEPYVYRLIVDDDVNALPTADLVEITVVDELPSMTAPVAVIEGPAGAVALGSTVTLVSRSYDPDTLDTDPDGDDLTFRWQQTNELGGALLADELQDAFQPLGGLTSKSVSWQALETGTFYFRLLVDDGDFRSNATFSVEVVDTETSGETVSAEGETRRSDDSQFDLTAATGAASSTCGVGALTFSLLPAAFCLLRRRQH